MFQLRAQMDVTVSDLEWQEAWSLSQSGYSLFSGSPLSFGSEKEKAYSCDSVGGMGYTCLGIKRRCMQIRAVVWVVNLCVCVYVCLWRGRQPQIEWEMWRSLEKYDQHQITTSSSLFVTSQGLDASVDKTKPGRWYQRGFCLVFHKSDSIYIS